MNEPTTRNITVLNRASVKRYALKVSADRRAGKFSRVGEEFFTRCEARLEAAIRGVIGPDAEGRPMTSDTFITSTAREKIDDRLEMAARQIVYSEVMKHPSLGVTLK